MKNILLAPVGDHIEDLYIAINDFQVEKIILLVPEARLKEADAAKDELTKLNINIELKNIVGNIWEDMFRVVSEIKGFYPKNDIIIITSTGDRTTACAATSAAFVNGLKAVAVDDGEVRLLPILKFSYYKILTDKKMEILQFLHKNEYCPSLEELSKNVNMSLPLISYHLNGNLKSEGLRDLGLVETNNVKGKTQIRLSIQGRLLIKGYIKP